VAAEAARRQGEKAFDSFHVTLLKARHEERLDIADVGTLKDVGKNAGLEMTQFERDLDDHSLLAKLAEDHTYAAEKLGVFGTPTLVFPEDQAVFIKMASPSSPEESVSVFNEVRQMAEGRRNILEVKRPQRPSG
jgi:predicted DsbA family dithiol-disulfide isomerase